MGNWRRRKLTTPLEGATIRKWVLAVLCLAAIAFVLASCGAAAGPADAGTGPCEEVVEGAHGRIIPKTSDLSCQEIKMLIEIRPPKPGRFSTAGAEGGGWWKCDISPPGSERLLTCHNGERYFTIVRSG
jgi:hypothetical protein